MITATYLGVDAERLEQARQAMERNVQRNFISSALDSVVQDALLTFCHQNRPTKILCNLTV
jgi:hypothetical protein